MTHVPLSAARAAAVTIVSRNYMPFARVLAASFRRHNPGADFFVGVVDDVDGVIPSTDDYRVLRLDRLGIPDYFERALYYDVTELSTSVKPDALRHVLGLGYAAALYLDPDILVTGSLAPLFDLLGTHHVVLTPHMLSPVDDGAFPNEIDMLKTGAYNLGFVGVRASDEGRRMLDWWARRLQDHCFVDAQNGLFTDQKWMDMTPSFFDGVHILKDPGYNVAYWNFHERRLEPVAGGHAVRGPLGAPVPLRFFHFSGIDVNNVEVVSKYQNRSTLRERPDLRPLFEEYASRVKAATTEEDRRYRYAFGTFSDGRPIDTLTRRLYYRYFLAGRSRGNPFSVLPGNNYRAWLDWRGLVPTGLQSEDWEQEKVLHKAEDVISAHYGHLFRVAAAGFRLVRRALGAKRYAQALQFLNFISNPMRNAYVFLPGELERTAQGQRVRPSR